MLEGLRQRFVPQLRRDVEMILRGLRGERAAPFTVRSAKVQAGSAGRRLVLAEVRRETPDAVTLVMRDPTGSPIPFAAGQFFTISRVIGNETIKRAYSASSSALEPDTVAITVKRVDGGRVSSHIHEHARAGESIEVLGPSGSFTSPPWARDLVLIGGGSGITPLMSIAKTALASAEDSRVTLVFGNRSQDDVIFEREIGRLEALYGDRFEVRHVLERHDGAASRLAPRRLGRLDEAVLSVELADLAQRSGALFFVCGPEPVMAAAERVLEARGVDGERIKVERFSSLRTADASTVAEPVKVTMGGEHFDFVVEPGETILEAGSKRGLPMPFSCTVGGCGACMVRLTEGEVVMDEPNCLSADERRNGYVLACVSRPLRPCSLEVE